MFSCHECLSTLCLDGLQILILILLLNPILNFVPPFLQKKKCLMFASRVVIPLSLQKHVLMSLHNGHPGIVRMKLLARCVCWWLNQNADIEAFCQNCGPCAKLNFKPSPADDYPWPVVKHPFERVHIDFFQYKSVNFFLDIDSSSKWFYVTALESSNADSVILVLLHIFAFWGLPTKMVSDNGPPFTSDAYKEFCTKYDIQLIYSPPYHPKSNSAERSVQTCKSLAEDLYFE